MVFGDTCEWDETTGRSAPFFYHETYRKMNTNTILRIYQTYSLEKISALSKQSLIAQYAQNEQLVKLNKQLAANNSATNKILQNQIKELERQEKCRFYKNLIFNLKLATDKIENQPICYFRLFLSSFFLKPIEAYAKESISNLEEIKDKEYAQEVLERVNSISLSNQNYIEGYSKSAWALYLPTKEAYESKEFILGIEKNKKEIEIIEEKKQKLLKEIDWIENARNEKIKFEKSYHDVFSSLGLMLLIIAIGGLIYMYINGSTYANSFLVLLGIAIILIVIGLIRIAREGSKRHSSHLESILEYMRGHRDIDTSEFKEKEKKINQKFDKQKEPYQDKVENLNHKTKELGKEIEELEMKDKENKESFASISKQMIEECPDWEEQINIIIQLLPHTKEEKLDQDQLDPLFEQAARAIVSSQIGSTSMIQRMFSIGYNRAEHLMDQLEKAGIVGPAHGTKPREVLFTDEKAIDNHISSLRRGTR